MQDLVEAVLEQAAVPGTPVWIDTGMHKGPKVPFGPPEDPDTMQTLEVYRARRTGPIVQYAIERIAWYDMQGEDMTAREWEPIMYVSDALTAVSVLPAPKGAKWRVMADGGTNVADEFWHLPGEVLLTVPTAALAARVLAMAVQA